MTPTSRCLSTPEAFDIDFMRDFWNFAMDPAQQAEAEAAALFFVLTHWGPPAPALDLAEVAIPCPAHNARTLSSCMGLSA